MFLPDLKLRAACKMQEAQRAQAVESSGSSVRLWLSAQRLGGRWTSETDTSWGQREMKRILRRARLCSIMGKEVRLVRKLRESALRLGGKQSSGRVWRPGMSEIHGLSREARFFSQLVVVNKGMLFLFPIKVRVLSGGSGLRAGNWNRSWCNCGEQSILRSSRDVRRWRPAWGIPVNKWGLLMTSFSRVAGSSIIPF